MYSYDLYVGDVYSVNYPKDNINQLIIQNINLINNLSIYIYYFLIYPEYNKI